MAFRIHFVNPSARSGPQVSKQLLQGAQHQAAGHRSEMCRQNVGRLRPLWCPEASLGMSHGVGGFHLAWLSLVTRAKKNSTEVGVVRNEDMCPRLPATVPQSLGSAWESTALT